MDKNNKKTKMKPSLAEANMEHKQVSLEGVATTTADIQCHKS